MSYVLLFLQLALILAVATVFGRIAIRFRIPAVAGELLAGVIIGPTILGRFLPGFDVLLPGPADIASDRTAFVRVGLLFFMFLAGLEVNVGEVRSRARQVASTSFFGLVIPFGIGALLVVALPGLWSARTVEAPHLLPFVIGTALAISALPVIARILMDLGLMKSEVGIVVMAAAAVDDIVGWSVFAAILGVANASHGGLPPALMVALVLAAFALALTLGRGLWQRVLDRASPPDGDPLRAVGVIAVAILLAFFL